MKNSDFLRTPPRGSASERAAEVPQVLMNGSNKRVAPWLRLGLCLLLAGAAGAATVDPYFKSDSLSAIKVAVQADGKILVAGNMINYGPNGHSGITRLNRDGTPDATFNPVGGGVSSTANPGIVEVREMLIGHDGKILIGSPFMRGYNGTSCKGLVRLNPDGTLDNVFIGLSNNGVYNNYIYRTGLGTTPNNSVLAFVDVRGAADYNSSLLTSFRSDGTGGPLVNGNNSIADDSFFQLQTSLGPGYLYTPMYIQPFDDKIVVSRGVIIQLPDGITASSDSIQTPRSTLHLPARLLVACEQR